MDSRDTRANLHRVHGHHWSFNGLSKVLQKGLVIFEILSGWFYIFYKIHSLNTLNIMEHNFGHGHPNGTLNGPCEADFRGPLVKKTLQDPSMV